MSNLAPQTYEMPVSQKRIQTVSFDDVLEPGESMVGTPIITEVGGSDLTLDSKRIMASYLTIFNRTIAAGRALQFRVIASGATPDTTYTINLSCQTDSAPAQTVTGKIQIPIVAD